MKASTEFDVGPLSWVKSEIGQALASADHALQKFMAGADSGAGDPAQLGIARNRLHQAQGALAIVGLDGVTDFAAAVEAMLAGMESQEPQAVRPHLDLAQRSLAAIARYLDDLAAGQANQPLRLLSLYSEVQKARGEDRFSPADLFFPDLTVDPPGRTVSRPDLSEAELQQLLKQERARFQRGLLSWLRAPGDRNGIGEMLGAVRCIEGVQETKSARAFWWVAASFLAALAEGSLHGEANARQLCSRIDLQIRRQLEGAKDVAERPMREALYFVATAESDNAAVQQVKSAFRLQALIPAAQTGASVAALSVKHALREAIGAAEENWAKFCAGAAPALPAFRERASALAAVADQLGHTDYRRLAQAIVAAANWLADDSSRHSEALAMEIATATLLARNAQENFERLGSDFARQVDVAVARVHACIAGNPPMPGSEVPLLDEISRQAQEKLLIGRVAKEMHGNLARVEQALEGFFGDAALRSELAGIEQPLNQVIGALNMMRHESAAAALRACAAETRRFAQPGYVPRESDFQKVAGQLSMVGLFIDSLEYSATDYEGFIQQLQRRPAGQEGEQAETVPVALDTGENPLPSIDRLMAALDPEQAEPMPTSAQDVPAVPVATDGIDPELLGIFLEECREVLGAIAENLALLTEQPLAGEALATIRRGFHTIKGSGRMVGLKDVGETAWALEQTLNFWLQKELGVNAELLDLIARGHAICSEWARCLETHAGTAPDPAPVIALAGLLLHEYEGNAQSPEPAVLVASAEEVAADEAAFVPAAEPQRTVEPIVLDGLPATPAAGMTEDIDREAAEAVEAPGIVAASPGVAPDRSPPGTGVTAAMAAGIPAATKAGQRISITPALYEIFSEEANAHLATLQHAILALEQDEAAATPQDMYRAAHTLAGISATVGIEPAHLLALALEHALARRDDSHQRRSLAALGVVRQAVGDLELMLSALAGQRDIHVPQALIESLDGLYPARAATAEPSATGVQAAAAEIPAGKTGPSAEPAATDPGEAGTFPGEMPRLQDEIDEQLLPLFLDEARDLAEGICGQLRAWRESPGDGEAVRTLARLLHTLKGGARMAGAMNLGEITHVIEARVEHASRDGSAALALIDEIASAFDAVQEIIERLQRGESLERPMVAVAAPAMQAATMAAAEPEGGPASPPEAARPAVERRKDRLRLAAIEAENDATAQRAVLRVRADLVDRLVNDAGELSIARARIEGEMRSLKESLLDLTENVSRLRRHVREIEIQAETQMQSRTAQAEEVHAGFDPLEFDRFTHFQELTRMMAESVNDVATIQQGLFKNLDDANAAIIAQARLNRDLQQGLMGARMVPFGSLADRLYRVVRQTAKDLDKRVHLEMIGGQLELDRSVLDKIAAPLEHMLRNAIAHGLEDSPTRAARGKPETGEIALALKQEGNEVMLRMSDDGGGLDYGRIRARAIAAGLLGKDEATDDARLAKMIFVPGFSTATEVSQVAGRGVGMDVVRSEIAGLGGRIEIVSAPGQGTEFLLFVPLTLAVTRALLVRAGDRIYAIPSAMIEQVLDFKEDGLKRSRAAGSAEWMGNDYPFAYLPELLGERQALPEQRRQHWVLLLRSGTRRISMLVDELQGNQEVVVKNIGPQLARVVGVDGATVLANGDVVLILNPVALASRPPAGFMGEAAALPPAGEEAGAASPAPPAVMIVDDSLTVRKITGRLLSRQGYRVLTAKDGVDALEQLADVIPEVMLVDIEMPRMDGFEFVRNVRADKRLKNVAIVMITSRTAEKHRSLAFELGVDNYLGKPYQEEELLRIVADYVRERRSA